MYKYANDRYSPMNRLSSARTRIGDVRKLITPASHSERMMLEPLEIFTDFHQILQLFMYKEYCHL
jgi:hypothetical protein